MCIESKSYESLNIPCRIISKNFSKNLILALSARLLLTHQNIPCNKKSVLVQNHISLKLYPAKITHYFSHSQTPNLPLAENSTFTNKM